MAKPKVFITGVTGFLGSAILAQLVNEGYELLAAKRTTSNTDKCSHILSEVHWVDTDQENYISQVIHFSPEIIIHAAWAGVTAKGRADWEIQLENFSLLQDIIAIAQQSNLKKLIILGSQGEYGNINQKVDETFPANGNDAYATCKLATKTIVESFCREQKIDWYWLRVFSVYGPGEDSNWFIPWIILNQLNEVDSNLTHCEQQYDYLFVEDFATMIEKVVSFSGSRSGTYNICSGNSISLRTVAETIKAKISSKAALNFGAVSYRANQSMYIGGDNSKYKITFGEITSGFGIESGLEKTINFYKARHLNKGA